MASGGRICDGSGSPASRRSSASVPSSTARCTGSGGTCRDRSWQRHSSAACISAPAAFFWMGAIRLVFALHAQCFVNSVCHTEPGVSPGEDSSRNVTWLGVMQFCQGENWHRNHHARPGIARLGWNWRQPDVGYLAICLLEKIGLATDVRHIRQENTQEIAGTVSKPSSDSPNPPDAGPGASFRSQ